MTYQLTTTGHRMVFNSEKNHYCIVEKTKSLIYVQNREAYVSSFFANANDSEPWNESLFRKYNIDLVKFVAYEKNGFNEQ